MVLRYQRGAGARPQPKHNDHLQCSQRLPGAGNLVAPRFLVYKAVLVQVGPPMQLQLILKLVLLLVTANGAPVLANKLLGAALAYPLDGRRSFIDGRPVLGPSKTIRGLIVALTATSVCAPLLDVAWTTGLVIGLAAMAGDLASSFVKRRIGYPSSGRALGLDQIPEALLPAVATMNLMALTIVDVIVVVALFSVGELVLSRVLFKLRIRNRPY